MWAVDGEGAGDWSWQQPEEEKPEGSIESVEKSKETINADEDGYETVRRPRQRTIGQFMPEIFAVEFEKKKKEESKSGDVKKIGYVGDVKKTGYVVPVDRNPGDVRKDKRLEMSRLFHRSPARLDVYK